MLIWSVKHAAKPAEQIVGFRGQLRLDSEHPQGCSAATVLPPPDGQCVESVNDATPASAPLIRMEWSTCSRARVWCCAHARRGDRRATFCHNEPQKNTEEHGNTDLLAGLPASAPCRWPSARPRSHHAQRGANSP
jgi:hypothetical protein